MRTLAITFGGKVVSIAFPTEFSPYIQRLFSAHKNTEPPSTPIFSIDHHRSSGRYSIRQEGNVIGGASRSADQCAALLDKLVVRAFIKSIDSGVALLGAAVSRGQKGVLLPTLPGDEKVILISWLMANGYDYLTDRLLVLPDAHKDLCTFPCAMKIARRVAPQVLPLVGLDEAAPELIHTPDKLLLPLRALSNAKLDEAVRPALILFADVRANHKFSATALTPAQAVIRLMGCVANSDRTDRLGLPVISALARNVPALEIVFDSIGQLNENMGALLEVLGATGELDPKTWVHFSRAFQVERTAPFQSTPPQTTTVTHPIPTRTPKGEKRKLTIGMATYDDFDGVYFSVQAIRMYHPEVTEHTEIIVVDNHPDGAASQPLKSLDTQVPGYRYVPFNRFHSTAVRDVIFRKASADFVLCMDSHVLLFPGALEKLIAYYDHHPQTSDLLHGPMLNDSLKTVSTHFRPTWGAGMYGQWGSDPRGSDPAGDPFEIQMQGLGLFTCRKASWPGFNPRFSGFGGEEGYIHEKFRQQGGKVLCLPFLRWLHRFLRPAGVQYPLNWKDRIRNYYIGFNELGLDRSEIDAHFTDHLGEEAFAAEKKEIEDELKNAFFYFDAIYLISLDNRFAIGPDQRRQFETLGIAHRLRRIGGLDISGEEVVDRIHLHRKVIEEAAMLALENVLVMDTDVGEQQIQKTAEGVNALKRSDWEVFSPCSVLITYSGREFLDHVGTDAIPRGITAYHCRAFQTVLDGLPQRPVCENNA
jgi:hypothetical protein